MLRSSLVSKVSVFRAQTNFQSTSLIFLVYLLNTDDSFPTANGCMLLQRTDTECVCVRARAYASYVKRLKIRFFYLTVLPDIKLHRKLNS